MRGPEAIARWVATVAMKYVQRGVGKLKQKLCFAKPRSATAASAGFNPL